MEFIDYAYYKEVYCGGLAQEEFNRVYPKVCAYFMGATRGRVEEADTSVCCALCELCDVFYEERSRDNIKSESCDGYSVTYKDTLNTYSLAWDILATYLETSGYLYGGSSI